MENAALGAMQIAMTAVALGAPVMEQIHRDSRSAGEPMLRPLWKKENSLYGGVCRPALALGDPGAIVLDMVSHGALPPAGRRAAPQRQHEQNSLSATLEIYLPVERHRARNGKYGRD
jgi:hypothetical protein